MTEANEMQFETFSTIKSGVDAVIQSPKGSGKSTTIVLNVLQRLEKQVGESTRALVFVQDKEQVLEMVELFKKLGNYMDIRVIGAHDKGDIDYDKNQISLGMDVIIGTTTKINAMFASAGFNMNTIKMFVVDDAEILFQKSIGCCNHAIVCECRKTQRLFFCSEISERVEILADKIMIEPLFFEMEE